MPEFFLSGPQVHAEEVEEVKTATCPPRARTEKQQRSRGGSRGQATALDQISATWVDVQSPVEAYKVGVAAGAAATRARAVPINAQSSSKVSHGVVR